MEKYSKLKEQIRRQKKATVRQITKEQQEELLEQERKKRKIFYEILQILLLSKVPMPFKG